MIRRSALTESVKRDFFAHVREEYPREACGVVKNNDTYYPCVNMADEPEWDFRIPSWRMTGNVTHVLHSHTLSQINHPSHSDIIHAEQWPQTTWGLVRTDGNNLGELVEWGRSEPIFPYEGRRFLFFIRDCAKLIIDWFEVERNIRLRNWPRRPYWEVDNRNLWIEAMHGLGFRRVEQPQIGDVMLTGRRYPDHGGVIVGDNHFLHHPEGRVDLASRLSRIDNLQRWMHLALAFYRLERSPAEAGQGKAQIGKAISHNS